MTVESTGLEGCYLIRDTLFNDGRGYFFESYNQRRFLELTGMDVSFVQDNQSKSSYGVLRGLHFQEGEHAQAKLVRVLEGEVLDVAVDLRKGSSTFGRHFSVVLSGDSHTQLFVPRGFAHGFAVLSAEAVFFYKCDNFYNKAAEKGIQYNDPALGIDWRLPVEAIILSEKDRQNPLLSSIG